jgi:hypothetical protein
LIKAKGGKRALSMDSELAISDISSSEGDDEDQILLDEKRLMFKVKE